jgi:hypothetical protein
MLLIILFSPGFSYLMPLSPKYSLSKLFLIFLAGDRPLKADTKFQNHTESQE